MPLGTGVYQCLFDCLLSVLADIDPGVELLDHMAILCFIF